MGDRNIERVRNIIAAAIRELRNDDQDGYNDVRNGKFTGHYSLPLNVSPAELNALAAFAGIIPDGIKINGACGDCVFGDSRGGDLGWGQPCCSCSRPKMTNFVPIAKVTRALLNINDRQARLLQNALDDVWWATGLVPGHEDGKGWRPAWTPHLRACKAAETALIAHDMLATGALVGRRVTNKGMAALKRHNGKKRAA